MSQHQLQPWHIFSGVFVLFWILISYFDNFFITLALCIGGGFATDNLNKFMKGGPAHEHTSSEDKGKDDDDDLCPSKPLPPLPPEPIEEEHNIEQVDEIQHVDLPKEPSNYGEDLEQSHPNKEEKEAFEPPVMMETIEPINIEPSVLKKGDESTDLLGDFFQPPPKEAAKVEDLLSEDNVMIMDDFKSDLLVSDEIVESVAKTSLEEHENELANLLREAQKDSSSPELDEELEAVAAKAKDEGDPWMLDEEDPIQPRSSGGESLVHLDSDELANKDDISHCAVFGDENEQDDLDLDEDEQRRSSRGSTGSSSSDGPDEEPKMSKPTEIQDDQEEEQDSSSESEGPEMEKLQPNLVKNNDLPKPEVAAAKVEQTLQDLMESSSLTS